MTSNNSGQYQWVVLYIVPPLFILFWIGLVFAVVKGNKQDEVKRKAEAAAEGLDLEEYDARFPRTPHGYKKRKLELLEAIAGRLDGMESRIDAVERRQGWTEKTLD